MYKNILYVEVPIKDCMNSTAAQSYLCGEGAFGSETFHLRVYTLACVTCLINNGLLA